MRAAGTDATGLFNEIHPWVAWDSMLKACLVGNYVGRRESCNLLQRNCTVKFTFICLLQ